MNEKKKCPNCGLLIDSDMEKCPYCGFVIPKEDLDSKKEIIEETKIQPVSPKKDQKKFFKFEERRDVSNTKELLYFITGWLGIKLISYALQFITALVNGYFLTTIKGSAMINFACYFLLFGFMMIISIGDFSKIFSKFKKIRTYLYGISYGFLIIIVTSLYSTIVSYFYPSMGNNDNQTAIVSIANIYPLLSIIVFGFLGPICEELTYRLGFFSYIRKKSRLAAYVVVAILFGLIHFDFQSTDMVNEIVNLPSYIISGLLFCYVYDKEGIETSMTAHIFNNLIAVGSTIIAGLF